MWGCGLDRLGWVWDNGVEMMAVCSKEAGMLGMLFGIWLLVMVLVGEVTGHPVEGVWLGVVVWASIVSVGLGLGMGLAREVEGE